MDAKNAVKAVKTAICIISMIREIKTVLRYTLPPTPGILCPKTEKDDTRYRAVKRSASV